MTSSFTTRRAIGTAMIIIVALLPVAAAPWSLTRTRGGTLDFDDAPAANCSPRWRRRRG